MNGARKIRISKEMQRDLNKMAARQQYKAAMIVSFKENFDVIEKAGMNELYKSFMETGKGCKYITAGEYTDLAVQTWKEVIKNKTI